MLPDETCTNCDCIGKFETVLVRLMLNFAFQVLARRLTAAGIPFLSSISYGLYAMTRLLEGSLKKKPPSTGYKV
jgi:hypothetical protein